MTTESADTSSNCNMLDKHHSQVIGFHGSDRMSRMDVKQNDRLGVTVVKPPVCSFKGNTNEGNVTHPMCMKAGDVGHAHTLKYAKYDRNSTKCPAPK